MNKQHQEFIRKELIPFILREQGRGFGMARWVFHLSPGTEYRVDQVDRIVPVCGTVACIGGSVNFLTMRKNPSIPPYEISNIDLATKALGLTRDQGKGLFMRWQGAMGRNHWPVKFAEKYRRARTPLGKARVAAALLKEVARTKGKCLKHKAS